MKTPETEATKDGRPSGLAVAPCSPFLTMRAHQYLYYVMCRPVISDYEYDRFCKKHGLEGGGGSDRASDYSAHEIAHAMRLANTEMTHANRTEDRA